jgi:hypothetical protein
MKYGIFECIKMMRCATNFGLVDAKYLVERFFDVFNDGKREIDNLPMAWKFFQYVSNFARGYWIVNDGEIFPEFPRGIPDEDLIKALGK